MQGLHEARLITSSSPGGCSPSSSSASLLRLITSFRWRYWRVWFGHTHRGNRDRLAGQGRETAIPESKNDVAALNIGLDVAQFQGTEGCAESFHFDHFVAAHVDPA